MNKIWIVTNGLRFFGCPCFSDEEARELCAQHLDEHAVIFEATMEAKWNTYLYNSNPETALGNNLPDLSGIPEIMIPEQES